MARIRSLDTTGEVTPDSLYGPTSIDDAVDQLLAFAERSFSQYFPTKQATASVDRFLYRFYPETGSYIGVAVNVQPGDDLVESGVYVLGGSFGSSVTYVGRLLDFISPTNSTWPPKSIAGIGEPIFQPLMIPRDGENAPAIAGKVWNFAVREGIVKFAETGMTLGNGNALALLVAYFIEPISNQVCTTLVYRDSGRSIYEDGASNYGGCRTAAVDWIAGTVDGHLIHVNESGKCYKVSWSVASQATTTVETPCP